MSKKIRVSGCPLCGGKANWTKGDRSTRMTDRTMCLDCGLELEGDYKPQSSLEKWNFRVLDHLVQESFYNIDGERCD